ncbi:MAG: hypothetical protein M0T85_06005 [Dehalococcoidales bacterium]|nr:hypothetical protein [Dehalococcoidales bacterium]
MLRIAIVSLAIIALLVTGCGQVAQKAVEQATGVQVNQKGDSVTVKGKDGQSVQFSSQMPDELKDFPVPQGFKLDSSGSMSSGGDKLSVASWKGNGTVQDVAQFYKKNLTEKGWKEESSFNSQDGGLLNYSKGEQSATITIDKKDSGIEISLLLGKSNKKP